MMYSNIGLTCRETLPLNHYFSNLKIKSSLISITVLPEYASQIHDWPKVQIFVLQDENDNKPVFNSAEYQAKIDENWDTYIDFGK